MTFLLIAYFFLSGISASSTANTPSVKCKVEFQIVNAGVVVTGVVEEVVAEIQFNDKNLNKSRVVAKAHARSIRTGIDIRDKHLQRRDYFHTTRFENIELASQSFRKVGKDKFEGVFTLTIKDVTRMIVLPFTIERDHKAVTYTAVFKIDRLDYDLGEPSIILNDEVVISLHARVSY